MVPARATEITWSGQTAPEGSEHDQSIVSDRYQPLVPFGVAGMKVAFGGAGGVRSTRIVAVLYGPRTSPSTRSCCTARTRKTWTPSGRPVAVKGDAIGVAGSSPADATMPPSYPTRVASGSGWAEKVNVQSAA